MTNYNQISGNKNINPFELGTNEYNQSLKTPGPTASSFSSGFIGPVADFSYAETPDLASIGYNNAPPESLNISSSSGILALGPDGQGFLTFNQPPDWYVRENSLKIIDEISSEPTNEPMSFFVNNKVEYPKTFEDEVKIADELEDEEEDTSAIKKAISGAKKIAPPAKGTIATISRVVLEFGKAIFSLFFESFLGFGPDNRKPLTKEESAQKEKEVKKTENKKKFWQDLAQLSKPIPIVGAIKEEMLVTNQHNGFYEEYKGVVTNDARITEYHKANRFKKEIENKANQIQAQRSAKMQKAGVGKKPMGMPQQARAGELLMGTENPSHFTKALG